MLRHILLSIEQLSNSFCVAHTPQENLRQLCVFQLANESSKPQMWWDYIVRFGEECSMHDRTYNQACAEKVGALPLTSDEGVYACSCVLDREQSACALPRVAQSAVTWRSAAGKATWGHCDGH